MSSEAQEEFLRKERRTAGTGDARLAKPEDPIHEDREGEGGADTCSVVSVSILHGIKLNTYTTQTTLCQLIFATSTSMRVQQFVLTHA